MHQPTERDLNELRKSIPNIPRYYSMILNDVISLMPPKKEKQQNLHIHPL
jgi:hypothetical protein